MPPPLARHVVAQGAVGQPCSGCHAVARCRHPRSRWRHPLPAGSARPRSRVPRGGHVQEAERRRAGRPFNASSLSAPAPGWSAGRSPRAGPSAHRCCCPRPSACRRPAAKVIVLASPFALATWMASIRQATSPAAHVTRRHAGASRPRRPCSAAQTSQTTPVSVDHVGSACVPLRLSCAEMPVHMQRFTSDQR